ncbi:LysR substrate-binding domain-containing protein [Burkholderia pseudomallei]|uniref:LysR substrate-binding domain-containing protein n=1 Tax=Burkholderia pseudomallei TaxID=28450 RepID=UPI0022EB26AA|nr:LysR substrate-binding domain-containing protein [Burkholderia pseudomallei]
MSLPVSLGRRWALPALLDVAQRHPLLRLDLLFTDRRSDLVDEGIDRAVRIGDPRGGSASLACRGLGRRRSAPCASPAYLARRGRSRRSGAGARRRTPAPGGRRLGDRLSAHGLSKSGLIGLKRAGRALA